MTLKKGQTVALLDTADLECTVAMRKADLGVAEAALAALLAGSRPQEIESARATWEKGGPRAGRSGSRLAARGDRRRRSDGRRGRRRREPAADRLPPQDAAVPTGNHHVGGIRDVQGRLPSRPRKAPRGRRTTETRQARVSQGTDRGGPLGGGTGQGAIRSGQGRAAPGGHRPGQSPSQTGQGRARFGRNPA